MYMGPLIFENLLMLPYQVIPFASVGKLECTSMCSFGLLSFSKLPRDSATHNGSPAKSSWQYFYNWHKQVAQTVSCRKGFNVPEGQCLCEFINAAKSI